MADPWQPARHHNGQTHNVQGSPAFQIQPDQLSTTYPVTPSSRLYTRSSQWHDPTPANVPQQSTDPCKLNEHDLDESLVVPRNLNNIAHVSHSDDAIDLYAPYANNGLEFDDLFATGPPNPGPYPAEYIGYLPDMNGITWPADMDRQSDQFEDLIRGQQRWEPISSKHGSEFASRFESPLSDPCSQNVSRPVDFLAMDETGPHSREERAVHGLSSLHGNGNNVAHLAEGTLPEAPLGKQRPDLLTPNMHGFNLWEQRQSRHDRVEKAPLTQSPSPRLRSQSWVQPQTGGAPRTEDAGEALARIIQDREMTQLDDTYSVAVARENSEELHTHLGLALSAHHQGVSYQGWIEDEKSEQLRYQAIEEALGEPLDPSIRLVHKPLFGPQEPSGGIYALPLICASSPQVAPSPTVTIASLIKPSSSIKHKRQLSRARPLPKNPRGPRLRPPLPPLEETTEDVVAVMSREDRARHKKRCQDKARRERKKADEAARKRVGLL